MNIVLYIHRTDDTNILYILVTVHLDFMDTLV